jgi:hypothetical protein
MRTINHELEKTVLEADGRFLNSRELDILERYLNSYDKRQQTYQLLRDNSKTLVIAALRRLFEKYPDLLQKHKQRCAYDMSEVLRYVALSVLRDDETFFMEATLSWLDTILVAYKKNNACSDAYRFLKEAVDKHLPSHSSLLVSPYLDRVQQILGSHA